MITRRIATLLLLAVVMPAGCSSRQQAAAPLTRWSFEPRMIFPSDHSLKRPEDGVLLNDGSLVVSDQVVGLRLVSLDGSSRPFGRMTQVGYVHRPPEILGGPNGVAFEPGETHILVGDIYRGGIYRIDVDTEATELIYQHPFGVNTVRRDSSGGIWFTQSTRNKPEHGEQELFRAVGVPVGDGALYYIPPGKGGEKLAAKPVVENLFFANGFVLDEDAGYLYLAETTANRVSRYRLNTTAGTVSEGTVAVTLSHPDNIERDGDGRLWIASPVRSEVVVFDPATGARQSVFRIETPASARRIDAIEARISSGTSWIDLLAPDLWQPGPGMITGMILSSDDGPIYLTGLGDALIRLR